MAGLGAVELQVFLCSRGTYRPWAVCAFSVTCHMPHMGKEKSAGNACVDGVPVPVWVLCIPALQDGRVSASAAYDGRETKRFP